MKEVAALEEKMNTSYERLLAEMADFKTDMAKYDKDNLCWQIGLWVAAIIILGFLIRL
ncbi:MAG: hypothetical protein OXE41_07900 [Gammaproteobacteria bacterium]|nr:hypothetical protein [Gammaproteobacteria bacterium]MCY4218945.1 hypothetical protein [Gammaproteobacteria bacterium]MCY4275299.1 hypothetical protein [Gammaproteobacteria bacterium]